MKRAVSTRAQAQRRGRGFKYRPREIQDRPRRRISREELACAAAQEIHYGRDGIARLYAALLLRRVAEIDEQVGVAFGRVLDELNAE